MGPTDAGLHKRPRRLPAIHFGGDAKNRSNPVRILAKVLSYLEVIS
jgi:hypothetical protein